MKNKWLALLRQLEIIKTTPGPGEEKWSQEKLLAFENETNIILPDEYKSFCQIFGSGAFGAYIQIYCPYIEISDFYIKGLKEHLNFFKGTISTNKNSITLDIVSFHNLLDNAFCFGGSSNLHLVFFDLRTYNELDQSYDIYITSISDFFPDGWVYKICRSFYQFVTEFCLGTKSYEIFPQELHENPEYITLTFSPFSTKLVFFSCFPAQARFNDNNPINEDEPTKDNELTDDNEDCSPTDNFQHLCLPQKLIFINRDSEAADREISEQYQSIKDKHPYAFFRYLKTFKGHLAAVYAVKFSSNGKTLISGSADNTIKLWNLTTPQESLTLRGHTDAVLSLAVSPNGKTLASGGADSTIKLWDLNKAQEIKTLVDHTNSVLSLAISPDGQTLASSSADKTIKLWDLKTGQLIRTLKGHHHSVLSVAISPNGKLLASGSADSTLKLWNLITGEEISTLDKNNNFVFAVCFHLSKQLLISLNGNRMIKSWCLSTKNLLSTIKTSATFISMAISPSGQTLAGSEIILPSLKMWDLDTGKCITYFENCNNSLVYHQDLIYNLAFSPDGKLLASGSKDTTIKLWGVPTPRFHQTQKSNTLFS